MLKRLGLTILTMRTGKYETSQDEELDQDDDCAGYEQHADPQGCDDDEPGEGHAFDNNAEEEEAIDDHVPREDHAHYDTPEVETVGFAESDVPVEDDAWQDLSSCSNNEEEDELAWEDSPYY